MEGIATEAVLPGTYCLESLGEEARPRLSLSLFVFTLRNYIVARNLAIQIPRALGPPVARGLIDLWGRNTYAVLQLSLSLFAISGVWYAAKNARCPSLYAK